MKQKMIGMLAALATMLGVTVVAATPAFAEWTNVCHRVSGATTSLIVQRGDGGLGEIGNLAKGECAYSKWGWGDTQRFYVPSGYNVRSYFYRTDGTQYVGKTFTATGWYRTVDALQTNYNEARMDIAHE
jgi:hypothetical protein